MGRKHGFSTIAKIVAIAVTIMMVTSAFAQEGQKKRRRRKKRGRQGRQRAMMRQMVFPELSWTAVSLQLDCEDNQIEKLRPTFKSALDTRTKDIKKAVENQDPKAAGKAIQKCNRTLAPELKKVLSEDQLKKLGKFIQGPFRRKRRGPRPRKGPGGGGQGQ